MAHDMQYSPMEQVSGQITTDDIEHLPEVSATIGYQRSWFMATAMEVHGG